MRLYEDKQPDMLVCPQCQDLLICVKDKDCCYCYGCDVVWKRSEVKEYTPFGEGEVLTL